MRGIGRPSFAAVENRTGRLDRVADLGEAPCQLGRVLAPPRDLLGSTGGKLMIVPRADVPDSEAEASPAIIAMNARQPANPKNAVAGEQRSFIPTPSASWRESFPVGRSQLTTGG